MIARIESTEKPAARPATTEWLGPEGNVGVVLAEAAVADGEGIVDAGDELNVDGVDNAGTKALGLEEAVTFGLMTKPRLISVLSTKPIG